MNNRSFRRYLQDTQDKLPDQGQKYSIQDSLIEKYTHEPGVRELKRKIETIFLKLNVDRIYGKGLFMCECKKALNQDLKNQAEEKENI